MKGYQVLVGWITLDLALAISMLSLISFPDEGQVGFELIKEFEETALMYVDLNYRF